jgi:hypothetical protein
MSLIFMTIFILQCNHFVFLSLILLLIVCRLILVDSVDYPKKKLKQIFLKTLKGGPMLRSRSFIILAATASAVFFWTGCTNDPVSSTHNSDNQEQISAGSVGAVAFSSLNESSEARDAISITASTPQNLLSSALLPALSNPLSKSLSKSMAQQITFDTVGNILRVTSTDSSTLKVKYDTVDVLLSATEKILSLRGSTNYAIGKIESYSVSDLDGDNILNSTEGNQKVTLCLNTTYTKDILLNKAGTHESVKLQIGAGKDNDFNASADNLIYDALWVKIKSNDTLGFAHYTDADGDGVVFGTAENSLIDLVCYESANPLKPLVDYSSVHIKMEKSVTGTEKRVYFTAQEKLVTGRLNRVWVVDSRGDSIISQGEKAFIHFATNSPFVSDTETTADAIFEINPGTDLASVTDDTLYSMSFSKEFRLGNVKHAQFSFKADPPVPYGQIASGGSFELSLEFFSGKTASLSGAFSKDKLEAAYTGPEGNAVNVSIDKTGSVVTKN